MAGVRRLEKIKKDSLEGYAVNDWLLLWTNPDVAVDGAEIQTLDQNYARLSFGNWRLALITDGE